jgi:hypothetical protein
MFQFFGLKKKNLCKYKMEPEKYNYKVKELVNTSFKFKEQFDQLYIFGDMDYEQRKGCKIGHVGGIIQIYTASYFQSISRWWNGESRMELLKYLDSEVADYITFLNNLSNIRKFNPYKQDLKDLCENNIKFIKCIIPGLEKCKYIYSDFKELEGKIDKYTNSLRDFNKKHSDRDIISLSPEQQQQQQHQSILSLSNYPNMTSTTLFNKKTNINK